MYRILIVEDDPRVSALIRRGLEEEGFTVAHASDGLKGREMALQNNYDALIIDVMLPILDGLTLCKYLRKARPRLPILMLTALGTTDDKVSGLDAGADDYLVKPFEMRELVARIRALLRRYAEHPDVSGALLTFADLEMNLDTLTVRRKGREIRLTPKEFKLLEYFLRNPNRVLTRAEIAENVWGIHFDTGTNFIDVYINYLRNKVDKGFVQKLIHTRPGMGFILKVE
ncbi:MAG: response regulator transcription factor [Saprospiraceae bacterium]|nr:response regulator transcription factor [Saprospiraceae bacterium]MDW8482696.1 response regulator transcription factor [Saprospiraceae bacterium]